MKKFGTRSANRAARMEAEANQFAAELLLPRKAFQRDLNRFASIDLEHVVRLSDKYDMSREATARRYVDLNNEACAIVFSHNGRVRYPYRNRHFPFVEIGAGEALPSESIAVRADFQEGKASDWSETDGATWLTSKRGTRSRGLIEQTLVQQSGYQMTLIALEDADEADEDDNFDYEESWKARFRR